MRILSPRLHGYIDYALVALMVLAPTILGFSGVPAMIAYVLAGVHLTMTLFTAFPLGAIKIIPFKVHGGLELAVSVLLIAIPWLFDFEHLDVARNFYLASGGLVALVWGITNYRAADAPRATVTTPSPAPSLS